MKNFIATIILILLGFIMTWAIVKCADKQAELNCINNLDIDEDINICLGE